MPTAPIKKMLTAVCEGTIIGAEILRPAGSGFIVELDTCEEAYLSGSDLAGGNAVMRLDRACSLHVGQQLTVEVISVYQGRRFENKIEVREYVAAKAQTKS